MQETNLERIRIALDVNNGEGSKDKKDKKHASRDIRIQAAINACKDNTRQKVEIVLYGNKKYIEEYLKKNNIDREILGTELTIVNASPSDDLDNNGPQFNEQNRDSVTQMVEDFGNEKLDAMLYFGDTAQYLKTITINRQLKRSTHISREIVKEFKKIKDILKKTINPGKENITEEELKLLSTFLTYVEEKGLYNLLHETNNKNNLDEIRDRLKNHKSLNWEHKLKNKEFLGKTISHNDKNEQPNTGKLDIHNEYISSLKKEETDKDIKFINKVLLLLEEINSKIQSSMPFFKLLPNTVIMGDVGSKTEFDTSNYISVAYDMAEYCKKNNIPLPPMYILADGEEDKKGTKTDKYASALLSIMFPKEFKGYAEGDKLFNEKYRGACILTDGKTGNVTIKLLKGILAYISNNLSEEFRRNLLRKISGASAKPALMAAFEEAIAARESAARILGIGTNGGIYKGNSQSDRKQISGSILEAIEIAAQAKNK